MGERHKAHKEVKKKKKRVNLEEGAGERNDREAQDAKNGTEK